MQTRLVVLSSILLAVVGCKKPPPPSGTFKTKAAVRTTATGSGADWSGPDQQDFNYKFELSLTEAGAATLHVKSADLDNEEYECTGDAKWNDERSRLLLEDMTCKDVKLPADHEFCKSLTGSLALEYHSGSKRFDVEKLSFEAKRKENCFPSFDTLKLHKASEMKLE